MGKNSVTYSPGYNIHIYIIYKYIHIIQISREEMPKFSILIMGYRGIHELKSNHATQPFDLASKPTKFLSCDSRSAHLTKERLAIWCPC